MEPGTGVLRVLLEVTVPTDRVIVRPASACGPPEMSGVRVEPVRSVEKTDRTGRDTAEQSRGRKGGGVRTIGGNGRAYEQRNPHAVPGGTSRRKAQPRAAWGFAPSAASQRVNA